MTNDKLNTIYIHDYTQSANSLFHFMDKIEFLISILKTRTIYPRYCVENVDYLDISVSGEKFDKIAIIQKCFCDIPITKITKNFNLEGVGSVFDGLEQNEKIRAEHNNSHTDFYGEFGISFSKEWGEKNNLQPIQYINPASTYVKSFKDAFNKIIDLEDVLNEIADDVFNRLAYIKPIRGIMPRSFICDNSSETKIEFKKNFHDEKEWRYIPDVNLLESLQLSTIIANTNALEYDLAHLNRNIMKDDYNRLWLKYSYNDINYIIVPNQNSRLEIIDAILSIENHQFEDTKRIENIKHILISKILVIDEIRRDW